MMKAPLRIWVLAAAGTMSQPSASGQQPPASGQRPPGDGGFGVYSLRAENRR